MLKKDLIIRNPLRVLGQDMDSLLPPGGFGAVLARAGLGKTSILVQIALDSLLQGRNVLHISLMDSVKKVCLWYEEVFRNIAGRYRDQEMNQLWDVILPHRLIMTFNMDGFSVPKLDERLTELTDQDIFLPQQVLIDGLPFENTDQVRQHLTELKTLSENHAFNVWLTVRTHRHETELRDGIPQPLADVADLFDVAFQIMPGERKIHIRALKGGNTDTNHTGLVLDPTTMLITDS